VSQQEIEWITPAEAAEIMGVTIRTVQHQCQNHPETFTCKKWGQSWMVDKKSAEAYTKSLGGRPKSSKKPYENLASHEMF
jgi:hypothetical protein